MITPVFSEKSLKLAKEGKYTFWVNNDSAKDEIKAEISRLFDVHVTAIRTMVTSGESKRNVKGKKIKILGNKKAIVTLKEKEKIDLFEEAKK